MTAMLAVVLRNQGEGPVYKGRHLSEWVEMNGRASTYFDARDASTHFEALDDYNEAMKAAGTNAYPFLLKWIRHEDSQFRFTVLRLLESHISVERFNKLRTSAGAARAQGAFMSIRQLGTNAPPEFIQELTRLINDQSPVGTAVQATVALSGLGQPGLRELARALEHPSTDVQGIAIVSLELLHQLNRLDLPEKFFLPRLIVLASDTNSTSPASPASVSRRFLSNLNIEPDQYAPTLTILLSDPDSQVRDAASNALLKIAPEMLTNAPPQNGASPLASPHY